MRLTLLSSLQRGSANRAPAAGGRFPRTIDIPFGSGKAILRKALRISGHYVAYVGSSSNDEMHLSLGDAMDNVKEFNEYGPLLREHKDIVAEHERLESHPFDRQAH